MDKLRLDSKTLTLLFLLLLFLWLQCLESNNNNEIVGEEAAYLINLRNNISPAPSTWFTVTNMCEWSHVTCSFVLFNNNTRHVEEINLASKSLKGKLPPGLNNSLVNLRRLDVSYNSLTGPIPSFVGLSSLQELFIEHNFTSIPDFSFQGLTSLQKLILDNNTNLSPWTFPANLTASTGLITLSLYATNLIGSLPDTCHFFPNLQYLYLDTNNLTGVLPKSFEKLLNLKYLFLNDQSLSGRIEVLSSMTQLQVAWLERNFFEGPIPDLSNCTMLRYLMLGDNQLTGEVPPSLVNLPKLWQVSLANNWLQGPMPLFNTSVNETKLEGNGYCLDHPGPCHHTVATLLQLAQAFGYPLLLARSWRGNDPCKGWSFIRCDVQGKIRAVNLTKLNLNGTISPAFANLIDLQELYPGGNNLRESIPENLTTLSQLKILDVSNNNLSGIVPRFSPNMMINTTNNAFLVTRSPPPTLLPSPTKRTHHLWIKLGTL
ncbi:hypothetical protein PIB30_025760 [Stylosanthes scabra]|uniref:Leucine-rich repeat-containing N-terminal plant-type domain-containing protein n=1 Tax=Stylosanthes scabra TaxID=79078 RepID=A0ABU6RAH2_9FABA|nr:hypothetical protein [Stylosanthes scabra]